MNPLPRVLQRTAKPIAVDEFVDALRATCPPRFPGVADSSRSRPVGESKEFMLESNWCLPPASYE